VSTLSVEINITVVIDFDRTLLIAVGLDRSASANASLASTVADEHTKLRRYCVGAAELVDIARFEPTPPLFGVMSLEFRRDFWHRNTRLPGLSYAVLTVILGLAIFVQLRLVTDGRTDRHMMTANMVLA